MKVKWTGLLVITAILLTSMPALAQGELPPPQPILPDGFLPGEADQVDAGIQDLSLSFPYPGWLQTNKDGFGMGASHTIGCMETFNGKLYAGMWNVPGGAIWRSSNGKTWSQFTPSFTGTEVTTIYDMQIFGTNLYIGVEDADASSSSGEIWRTNGLAWNQVVDGGFGNANNRGVNSLAVFNGYIYAATSTNDNVFQIYRSSTGNKGTWNVVVSDGLGSNGVGQDITMDVYNEYLYVGLGRNDVAELWRTKDGTTWTPVFTDGLGDNNSYVSSMATFSGAFYIGLRNIVDGGEVWRSTNGVDFTKVFDGGLGKTNNGRPYGLLVYNNRLYLVFSNLISSAEVWVTANGTNWEQISAAGWGDINNDIASYFDKAAVVFKKALFVGTMNFSTGGEVWRYTPPINRIFVSQATQDGWILESTESSNTGGSMNTTDTTLRLGDAKMDRQYRSILSFNTSSLPDNAIIQSVELKIYNSGPPIGSNPFDVLGNLTVDIRKGYFGSNANLELIDFNAAASASKVGTFDRNYVSNWYRATLNNNGRRFIDKTNLTQFRLYFSIDDNDDLGDDYMKVLSGEDPKKKPRLFITYILP